MKKAMGKNEAEETPNAHWADHVAEDLIKKHPGKSQFVCASGISPSGMVHIGNFREVVTVALVVRALESRGQKVRFIYSWDDYDAMRKVPENLPNQEMLTQNLRKPISKVPDPFGQDKSYAAHFEREFEESLSQVEIFPEFIRQNERYQRGDYVEGIKQALEGEKEIVGILNQYRTEPLPADWTCLSIFCSVCEKDITVLKGRDGDTFKFFCKVCKTERETSLADNGGGIKLLWRVDWPMRWSKEGVDFEPGGKDHSSQGGSYETGAQIIRKVWGKEPPEYLQYDFVLAKGIGAKLSSSSGGAGRMITLEDALTIYEPSVVRWIFAGRKPNLDFSIAFDLDVIRTYDDWDRNVRFALGMEEGDEKKVRYERRIYELSRTSQYPEVAEEKGKDFPQFAFRHLCNVLQINEGNLEKAKQYFAKSFRNAKDEARYLARAERAWKWINTFAPEDFKFLLRTDGNTPKTKYPDAVKQLVGLLREKGVSDSSEDELANKVWEIMKGNGIEPKAFFQDIYQILISKNQGPKLASFLLTLGTERAAGLIEKSL